MKKLYSTLFLFLAIGISANAQNEFFNDGADVTVEDGAEVYVRGEVVNQNAGEITNNGLIELSGDYTNTADYNWGGSGQRLIRFKTSGFNSPQTASGNLSFFDVEVENQRTFTAGTWSNGGLVINDNMSVAGQLDLKASQSMVRTNGNILEITNPSTNAIANYSDNSFIQLKGDGTDGLRRRIADNTTNNYDFPIGTENEAYSGFNINFTSNAPSGQSITAGFDATQDNPGTFGPTSGFSNNDWFSHIVTCQTGPFANQEQWIELSSMIQEYGIWDISPTGGSGWEYDVTLKADAQPSSNPTGPGIRGDFAENDPNTGAPYVFYKLLKTNDPVTSSKEWNDDVWNSGDICAGTNNTSGGFDPNRPFDGLQATSLTGFSKFGVGGNSDVGLPIELLTLEANGVDNEYIKVSWATATELNNEGFEVQRRTEGTDFQTIGWVDGNGTTQDEQHYNYDDHDVEPNTMYYYRLKQIDFNGEFEHTHVVSAMLKDGNVFAISDFIPNPTTEKSKLLVNTSERKELQIRLYNTLGQVISDKEITVEPGSNTIDFALENVADGTYHAIIAVDNEMFNRKLVVTKD